MDIAFRLSDEGRRGGNLWLYAEALSEGLSCGRIISELAEAVGQNRLTPIQLCERGFESRGNRSFDFCSGNLRVDPG